MQILNKEEKVNPLLSRKEIDLVVAFEGEAPSKESVKGLCSELGVDEKLCVVKEVMTSFGSNQAKIKIFAYTDEKEMERIESLTMHKKIEEKLKGAEEGKEEAKEEVKEAPEESKEEAKEETKEAPEEKENGEEGKKE